MQAPIFEPSAAHRMNRKHFCGKKFKNKKIATFLWQNKKINSNCHSFVAKIFFSAKLPQVICFVYFNRKKTASQKFDEAFFTRKHISGVKLT
jgi:hypothetical protein